jgi:hypothetical protein
MPPAGRTKQEQAAVELPPPPEELGLSRQSQFSTYKADDDPELAEEKNPPDGPHVVQELGKASETT